MKKVLKILGDIVLVLFVLLAIVLIISSINQDGNGISRVFGYIPLNVQTGSMKPTIKPGDLIITKEVDYDSLKENDIIAYLTEEEDTVIIVTHRIVRIEDNNGIKVLVTKGDNNPQEDEKKVTENNVVSLYEGTRLPSLGKALSFLKSQLGFFIFIILPLSILFIYQLYKFIVTIIDNKKRDLIDAAKAAAKKELEEEDDDKEEKKTSKK